MTTLDGAISHTPRRHRHRKESNPQRCPLCGSSISTATRARFDEKLRTQIADAEQMLRSRFARQQEEMAAKAAAEIAKAKANAAVQVEKTRGEAAEAAAAALAPTIAEAVAQAVQAEGVPENLADIAQRVVGMAKP
jgi:hypothetical protein